MSTDDPGVVLVDGSPTETGDVVSVIRPAPAYDEPDWDDFTLAAGVWTRVAVRDLGRAAFIVLKEPGLNVVRVQPGTNRLAVPFVIAASENIFVLRYVDFLTVVTGDFFALSAAGETITVGSVRLH